MPYLQDDDDLFMMFLTPLGKVSSRILGNAKAMAMVHGKQASLTCQTRYATV